MERRLQLAGEVVMLERCGREEDGVKRQPDERQAMWPLTGHTVMDR